MAMVMERPNGERHAVTDADIRRTLCGLTIGTETWRDDGLGQPVTCQACALLIERDPPITRRDPQGPWVVGCCDRDQGHAHIAHAPLWTEPELRAAWGDQ